MLLFSLSYALRFVWDEFLVLPLYNNNIFAYYFYYGLLCFIEGLTFMALLLVHYANFRQNSPVSLGGPRLQDQVTDQQSTANDDKNESLVILANQSNLTTSSMQSDDRDKRKASLESFRMMQFGLDPPL